MKKRNRGFIKLIVVLAAALIILGYFGFDVREILNSPKVSSNLHYAWGLITTFWSKFIAGPAAFVWNDIIIGLIWNTLVSVLRKGAV